MKGSMKRSKSSKPFAAILQGLREVAAHERGEITLRTMSISFHLPEADIKKLREKFRSIK